ncbi:hypothetical protein [Pararhizobium sp.]|uniref:hypothetical protein n=1 Tax=Pararhizobium sp. TaxID=1977563 RepID=UPI00271FE543|nr:hypothetical protein [Pararhizobium sp.]MDO9417015.1 hypothetical protein [Pararhizobium sp.]
MTSEEITELFIQAAEVDRRLPDTARPARLKAQALPYVHSDADQAGWGGERYSEERDAFWDSRSTRLKTADIAIWERANELIKIVTDESQRRCLWRWAKAKAGGRSFSIWCREEGIHVETGRRRKDRAIAKIEQRFARNTLQNNDITLFDLLPVAPEISDISVNIAAPVRKYTWRDDEAFSPVAVPELRDFSWADKRNEMRRQREAKKRQQAA